MGRNSQPLGKGMGIYFPVLSHGMGFAAVSHTMRNWLKESRNFRAIKHSTWWKFDGRGPPIFWEKYGYQFPRFFPEDAFVAFSNAIRYWLEEICISLAMKQTIRWESDDLLWFTLWLNNSCLWMNCYEFF